MNRIESQAAVEGPARNMECAGKAKRRRRFGFLVRDRAWVESTWAGSRLGSDQRTVTDAWLGEP